MLFLQNFNNAVEYSHFYQNHHSFLYFFIGPVEQPCLRHAQYNFTPSGERRPVCTFCLAALKKQVISRVFLT